MLLQPFHFVDTFIYCTFLTLCSWHVSFNFVLANKFDLIWWRPVANKHQFKYCCCSWLDCVASVCLHGNRAASPICQRSPVVKQNSKILIVNKEIYTRKTAKVWLSNWCRICRYFSRPKCQCVVLNVQLWSLLHGYAILHNDIFLTDIIGYNTSM